MLITPISSPTAMIIPTNMSTVQPDLMADNNNIFNLPETPPAPNHQKDWHVPMVAPIIITHIHAAEGTAIMKAGDPLDSKAKNWSGWVQSMVLLFKLFGIQEYVLGEVTYLDPKDDPMSAANWTYNDIFTQLLIMSNISVKERVHTNRCTSRHCMWLSLLLHSWALGPHFSFFFLTVIYLYDHMILTHMTDYLYNRAALPGTSLFPPFVHLLLFSLYGSLWPPLFVTPLFCDAYCLWLLLFSSSVCLVR